MAKCPGQDPRFWKPDDIFETECSKCGKPVEIFKDEPTSKCRSCGHTVVNPKLDLGCAKWCQHADQCLGVTKINNINTIREKLIGEMKKVFGQDQKRIEHALSVLDYSEKIQISEGGDPLIVKAAAILHDIGIQEAERKHGSSAGMYQEIEGPAIARKILETCGLEEQAIEHICKITGNHHSAKDIDTIEFRCVWDADWLVNIPEEFPNADKEKLQNHIKRIFKTQKGQQIAAELFLNK